MISKEQCVRCNAVGYFQYQCDQCSGYGRLICGTCRGSKLVPCKKCSGTGAVPCKTCDSTGRLFSIERISTTSEILRQRFLVGNFPPMKKPWFNKVNGQAPVQLDRDMPIGGDPSPKNGRTLYEKYSLRFIPTTTVTLKLPKDTKLFLVGPQHKLRNYWPLLDPRRITAGLILVLTITLGATLLLLR